MIRRGIIGRMMLFPFMKYVRETLLRTSNMRQFSYGRMEIGGRWLDDIVSNAK